MRLQDFLSVSTKLEKTIVKRVVSVTFYVALLASIKAMPKNITVLALVVARRK